MNELYQTTAVGDPKANTNEAVIPDERNRIAKQLKMLETLQEAQQIEARNDANQSWVSSKEMKNRLAKRDVGSQQSILE